MNDHTSQMLMQIEREGEWEVIRGRLLKMVKNYWWEIHIAKNPNDDEMTKGTNFEAPVKEFIKAMDDMNEHYRSRD